jgi:LAS superfamily LD-carboxypeptidase LdcB
VAAPGDIVNAGGISVHASIAAQVRALLADASSDGISLGGGGYRNSSSQVALRRAHCGTSDYAIYQMPSGNCHPPTAPPGRSQHERGLAIDFTCNGGIIGSRSSPCYRWLASNAGRYGLINLPSEPWHWSTTGR